MSDQEDDSDSAQQSLYELYHDFMRDKHVLLILDNVRDFQHIDLLLPNEGAAFRTIITSRQELFSTGVMINQIRIKPWTKDQTEKYFSERPEIPAAFRYFNEPEDRRKRFLKKLQEISNGKPIIATILVGLVNAVETRNEMILLFDKIITFGKIKGDALLSAMNMVFSVIPIVEADLEALSIFPGPFDAAAAASIWELLKVTKATEKLDKLVKMNLVMEERGAQFIIKNGPATMKMYRLHDLIRERMVDLAGKREYFLDKLKEHNKNLINHYIGCQSFYNDLIMSKVPDLGFLDRGAMYPAAASLFEMEEGNISDIYVRIGEIENERDRLILYSLFSTSAARVWDLLLPSKLRIEWISDGLASSTSLDEMFSKETDNTPDFRNMIQKIIVLNHIIAGVAERHQGNRPVANEHFEEALRISEEIGYDWGKSCAYGNLGNMQQEFSSHSKTEDEKILHLNNAATLHKNAEFYSELVKDKIGLAQDYGNQAIVMMDQWCINYKTIKKGKSSERQKMDREFEQSKKLYDERIRMAIEDINDLRGAANGYGNLATLHLERYRLDSHKASIDPIESGYLNAINWHKNANNLRGVAANEGNLGRAYRIIHSIKGDREYLDKAKIHLDSSLKHFQEIGDPEAIYIAQANILAWHLANNDKIIITMREKVKIQGEKCGCNISDESELWNLEAGEEPSRLRHLSDKYGKLHSVEFSSDANSSYPFADRISHSRSLCLEHLQLSLAYAYEANTM